MAVNRLKPSRRRNGIGCPSSLSNSNRGESEGRGARRGARSEEGRAFGFSRSIRPPPLAIFTHIPCACVRTFVRLFVRSYAHRLPHARERATERDRARWVSQSGFHRTNQGKEERNEQRLPTHHPERSLVAWLLASASWQAGKLGRESEQ